jgi:hypothetical protein
MGPDDQGAQQREELHKRLAEMQRRLDDSLARLPEKRREEVRANQLVMELETLRQVRNAQGRLAAHLPPDQRQRGKITWPDERIAALEAELGGMPRHLREQSTAYRVFLRWSRTRWGAAVFRQAVLLVLLVARVIQWYARRR